MIDKVVTFRHCLSAEGGEGLLVGNVGGVGVGVGAGESTSRGGSTSGTTTSTSLTTSTSTTASAALWTVSTGGSVTGGLGELAVDLDVNLLLLGLGGFAGGGLLLNGQRRPVSAPRRRQELTLPEKKSSMPSRTKALPSRVSELTVRPSFLPKAKAEAAFSARKSS